MILDDLEKVVVEPLDHNRNILFSTKSTDMETWHSIQEQSGAFPCRVFLVDAYLPPIAPSSRNGFRLSVGKDEA